MALTAGSGPAVAAGFGLPGSAPELAGPVARGYQGLVWRLTTSAGSWAVKEALAALDAVHVLAVARYEEAVADAGVFVPKPVRTPAAGVVAEVDGAELRCYEWVDLADLDTGLDPTEVGRTLAAIHRVPFDYPGSSDPWFSEPVGAAGWDALIERAAGRAPFAERLAAARDDLLAVERVLEPPARLQTCHRDLFADNVRKSGDRLCVFDWENCGEADPSMELAMVLFEYTRGDPQRSRELYGAYRDAGGSGRISGAGSFSMVIAVVNHIGWLGCRGWLAADDADDDAGRALNLGRVDEFLGELLTVTKVDDLVGAVTPGP